LGVGQAEIGLDRLRQDSEDLAVEEVENVGKKKQRQENAGMGPARS
jgi:hypothetical protein